MGSNMGLPARSRQRSKWKGPKIFAHKEKKGGGVEEGERKEGASAAFVARDTLYLIKFTGPTLRRTGVVHHVG